MTMQFFLARAQKIVFDKGTLRTENKAHYRKASVQTTWQKGEGADGNGHINARLSADINHKFGSILADKTLQLEVAVDFSSCDAYLFNIKSVKISGNDHLQQMCAAAKAGGLLVEVALEFNNTRSIGQPNDVHLTKTAFTKGRRIFGLSKEITSTIEWDGMTVSNMGAFRYWAQKEVDFETELDIMLTFSTADCGCPASIELKELNLIYKKMLNDASSADLSIVPISGKSIKCHRALLLAHSDMFKNEIKGEFVDANANFFKMPELTEDGVRALMDYMYLKDISKAGQNCGVALELYSISKKYDMKMLREQMRDLMVTKPDNWYKADMLIKFYGVAKSSEEDEDLKLRVVKLLKANKEAIKESEALIQYMKDDPTGLAELLYLAL